MCLYLGLIPTLHINLLQIFRNSSPRTFLVSNLHMKASGLARTAFDSLEITISSSLKDC